MLVIKTIRKMQSWSDRTRAARKTIGFVPTMGYLHEGHASLVDVARKKTDVVVASIFVNPIQFGPQEDLARYPRDFARDRKLLLAHKTDVIFYPDEAEMYARDFSTHVDVAGLTETLCGASRPGHFRGVATVVAKLFNIVKPDVAVFGAKDAQQAFVIKRMVRDLNFDVEIVIAPTVREPDGLAMSSRNTYLTPVQRRQATVLHRSLQLAEGLIADGERNPGKVIRLVTRLIEQESSGRIEYVSMVDASTLHDAKKIQGEVLIALAVYFGKTRLIDNVVVRVR